jgi:hypothetical protein
MNQSEELGAKQPPIQDRLKGQNLLWERLLDLLGLKAPNAPTPIGTITEADAATTSTALIQRRSRARGCACMIRLIRCVKSDPVTPSASCRQFCSLRRFFQHFTFGARVRIVNENRVELPACFSRDLAV